MIKGKVWLVGAGPGDPDLLTVKARQLIDKVDTVIYDRLVGDGILALIPETTEKINVGKQGGHHPVPQSRIEEIIVEKAYAGKQVLRLKGGDPFVFGRGGEEIETLIKNDICYEEVPGITSAIAAPASAGIPITHRGLATSFHVITAHTKDGSLPDKEYQKLAQLEGTLVFLMGVKALSHICTSLIKFGKSEDTPIAAIHGGTTAEQIKLTGTLSDFPKKAKEFGLQAPAVIVVGQVVTLAEKFSWKEKLPLNGIKVAVTRPKHKTGRLANMLKDKGAEVLELPSIATKTIHELLPEFTPYNYIVFTSPTGAATFFELLEEQNRDIRETVHMKFAAIGSATADEIRQHGIKVDIIPEIYDGVHLANKLVEISGSKNILLLRAEASSPDLCKILQSHGVQYREHHIYKTENVDNTIELDNLDMVLFTSASTVRGFVSSYPNILPDTVCCIGVQTAKEAKKYGFKNIKIAKKATLEELVHVAEECNNENTSQKA